jgi:signal transduction histidine kinase
MNFWVPYLLLFVCGILVSFSTTKLTESEEKLKRVNKQLSESNNKLAIWRNTYEKIQRDFSGVVSNSKNNLQHMQSEWDKDFKAAAGLGRHDVLNRIKLLRNDVSLLSNEQVDVQRKERLALFKQALIIGAENESTILKDNYDFVLSPWIDKMHVELKGLESTLDIVVTDVSIIEVLKAIQAGIPPDILQKKTSVDFLQNISENVDRNKKCRVILNKIKSIVFNLISNSAAATESRIDTFIENGDRDKIVAYVREIQLHIYEKIHMDKRCLCIEVNDNGGGFPEDILYKIYKEPIRTTKDNREYGQGTSYIGFFVDLMGADIEAKNINFENGERGASTLVYIPYLPE